PAAYPRLRDRLKGDEIVLLKASRGVALEGILPLLEGDFGGEPSGSQGSSEPRESSDSREGSEATDGEEG
ncbi:MAG: hypothetical protein KJO65_08500, partial [Gemmatimonadetes bacterium]|nr:hypothetical protein [Gemmatimonadota bacterium]